MSLRRTAGLKSNPETTRAWQDRSRKPIERGEGLGARRPASQPGRATADGSAGPPRTTLKRGKRKRRKRIPPEVRAMAYARTKGLCACGCGRKCSHVHHVLRVEDWPEFELVSGVMVGMFWRCHLAHEAAQPRLPYEKLPREVIAFVESVGPRAVAHMERYHPRGAEAGRHPATG